MKGLTTGQTQRSLCCPARSGFWAHPPAIENWYLDTMDLLVIIIIFLIIIINLNLYLYKFEIIIYIWMPWSENPPIATSLLHSSSHTARPAIGCDTKTWKSKYQSRGSAKLIAKGIGIFPAKRSNESYLFSIEFYPIRTWVPSYTIRPTESARPLLVAPTFQLALITSISACTW